MKRTLWVQKTPPHPRLLELTAGSDREWDKWLMPFDILGCIGHVAGLKASKLLTTREAKQLTLALQAAAAACKRGELTVTEHDEDCHSAVESFVSARLGALGGKLHMARSRNDQVAAALRLYMKHGLLDVHSRAVELVQSLAAFATAHGDAPLPGYTHTRRAMPSSVALWAGAFAAGLLDTLETLPAVWASLDRSPLGSASGYGVPLRLNRKATAQALGFSDIDQPVTLTQNSRGKLEAAALFWSVQLGHDAGKLACDVILFSGEEFGFFAIDGSLTTGSSLMPHKRNPDLFELARARAAALEGDLAQILALRGGLGSGYHRDFQLLKEPLMRGLSRASEMLEMLALGVAGLTPDRLRGAGAIDAGVRATGEALRRAQKGTPFREAYQQVSRELGQGLVPPSTSTATIDLGPIKQRLAAARRWSRSAARIR